MVSNEQLRTEFIRIRNLADAGLAISNMPTDDAMTTILQNLLARTWELCRDVNPNIIIRAGSAITPPERTPVQIIEKDRLQ